MKELNARAHRSEGARRKTTPLIAYPLSTLNPLARQSEATSAQLSTLNRDWPQLAHQASYSVSTLASACGVSIRTLERFFLPTFGDTPRRWLKRLRMQRAVELLRDGSNISETADRLGYKYPTHFSAEFKQVHGVPPRDYGSTSTERRRTASKCRISI